MSTLADAADELPDGHPRGPTLQAQPAYTVYADAVWRSLVRCFAAIVVLQILVIAAGVIGQSATSGTAALHIPVVLVEAYVARDAWRGKLTSRHVGALHASLMSTLVVLVITDRTTQSLLSATCVAAVSAVVVRRRWALALVTVDAIAYGLSRVETLGSSVDRSGILTESVIVAQNAGYAYGVMAISVFAAQAADATARRRRQSERRLALEQAAAVERRNVTAAVHDDVLHALALIARGTADGQAVRRQLHRATAVLQGRTTTRVDVIRVIEDMASELGLTARLTASINGHPPEVVATALTLATAESLRNVAIHAGASEVDIEIALAEHSARIMVSDHGRGFASQAAHSRRGVRRSILSRMADVGGKASITTEAGAGTLIDLSWFEAPRTSHQADAFASVRAHAAKPVWWLLPPSFAGVLCAAIFAIDQMAHPRLALAVVAITFVFSIVVIWRMSPLELSRRTYASCLIATPLIIALNGVAAGSGWTSAYVTFSFGGLSPALGIVALLGSTRQALVLSGTAVIAVTGLLALSDPRASVDGLLGCYAVFIYTTLIGMALRRLIDSLGSAASAEAAQADEITSEIAATEVRLAIREDSLQALRETILPRLEEWAEGMALDQPDPNRRAEAATLEAAARDSLAWPGLLNSRCIALLAEARRRGATIELRCDDEDALGGLGPEVSAVLAEVLTNLGSESLVVTLWAQDRHHRTMVLVGDADRIRLSNRPVQDFEQFGDTARTEILLPPTGVTPAFAT